VSSCLAIDDLTRRVRACSEAAVASGALVSTETRVRRVDDRGLPFAVRINENIARKEDAAQHSRSGSDPFAPPYEPDLYVGAISATHVVLLNKYNVLPGHLLLVTRADRPQTELLDPADFESALFALAGSGGLMFYNGGEEAGASQPHKHLQHVPLPLAPGAPPLPFAEALARSGLAEGVGTSPALPFAHALTPVPPAWWRAPGANARTAHQAWLALWQALGHDVSAGGEQPLPYNLLLTRQWMWLVPRTRGHWHGIAVNALGFAGTLLLRDQAQFDRLLRVGPTRLLVATAGQG